MDRRGFLRMSMVAAGAIAASSCSTTEKATEPGAIGRPILRLAGGGIPSFPSPFSYFQVPGYAGMILIYDTLLQADSTGEILPWLASSFERSDDGLSYTLELQDDVRWHDGQPFTIDDVLFTFDYIATKNPPGILGKPEFPLQVNARGPRTVEFRLDRPVVTFTEKVLATLPIVPEHIWAPIDDPAEAQDLALLIGTGPYRLESFSQAEGTALHVANDEFFLGPPFVSRVEARPVPNDDELTAVLAGAIDVGSSNPAGVTPDTLRPFRNDPSFRVVETTGGFLIPLKFSLGRGGPLDDVRFRQACAKAIDREDMVKRLLGGQGEVGNPGILPNDHPYHVDVEQYRYDPDAANRLLDEAGYTQVGPGGIRESPDGMPLRFSLLTTTASPAAELVIPQLRELGVELALRSADPLTIITSLSQGEYEMAVAFGGGQNEDPDFLRRLFSSRVNDSFQSAHGYANPVLDDLADRQLVTLDEAERMRIVADMQRLIAADLPFLPLYYSDAFLVSQAGAYEYYPAPSGTNDYNVFKHTYVTGEKNGLDIRDAG
jgi:peptide/nickel transport system substrate-binding protein